MARVKNPRTDTQYWYIDAWSQRYCFKCPVRPDCVGAEHPACPIYQAKQKAKLVKQAQGAHPQAVGA